MQPQIIALGELLVEVMRPGVDQPLSQPGKFLGPFPSGAPAIFVDAVARLGASAGIIGVVGGNARGFPDPFAKCVLDRLHADGADTRFVRVAADRTTGTAFVAYSGDGSRTFCFHLAHSAAALLGPSDVDPAYLAGSQWLHITGSALSIGDGAREACYQAVRLVKASGGSVSFDPNLRPELMSVDRILEICRPVLDHCDLLLPSGTEAVMLARGLPSDASPDRACSALVSRGVPMVALKRGELGSTVFTSDQRIQAPPLCVTQVDPTGAGDCYGAALVVGLLEGWDLAKAARFANVVGALSVTEQGPMEGAPLREQALSYV